MHTIKKKIEKKNNLKKTDVPTQAKLFRLVTQNTHTFLFDLSTTLQSNDQTQNTHTKWEPRNAYTKWEQHHLVW